MSRLARCCCACIAFLLLAAMGPDSFAQEGPPRSGWFRQLGRFQMPSIYERNHSKVKSAFRDVVDEPNQSTVRIFCGGKSAALGAVVDPEGYVLTKASELTSAIECQLADGRRFPAIVVGVLVQHDLAMLKIDAEGLVPVQWNQQPPSTGTLLATTGVGTVPTAIGVVSSRPLVIAPSRAILGVKLAEARRGARIAEVFDGSGASIAGLEPDDVVTHCNGQPLANYRALIEAIQELQPGDRVQLAVDRDGESFDVTVVLGNLEQIVHQDLEFQNQLGGAISARRAGFPQVVQHDTVLRPADCGGPVVDLDGKVVGINIARAGRVASYAIPSAVILPLLDELKSGQLAPQTLPELPQEQLTERLEQLQQLAEQWRRRLSRRQHDVERLQKEEAAAEELAQRLASDGQAHSELQRLRERRSAAQDAARRAEAELARVQDLLKGLQAEAAPLTRK